MLTVKSLPDCLQSHFPHCHSFIHSLSLLMILYELRGCDIIILVLEQINPNSHGFAHSWHSPVCVFLAEQPSTLFSVQALFISGLCSVSFYLACRWGKRLWSSNICSEPLHPANSLHLLITRTWQELAMWPHQDARGAGKGSPWMSRHFQATAPEGKHKSLWINWLSLPHSFFYAFLNYSVHLSVLLQ